MRLPLVAAVAVWAAVIGCARAGSTDPDCTCAAGEKYSGATDTCVAAADFAASAEDCGAQPEHIVCGCDRVEYTNTCRAYAAGTQVMADGLCSDVVTGGGGGKGGFGW